MVRKFLRVATLSEVLRVTPAEPTTQAETARQGGHDWGLWEFDRDAVGEIGDQSKCSHRIAPVRDLHIERQSWIGGENEKASKHKALGEDFAKGDFLAPPVILHVAECQWSYHVRDGAHRVHAAYDYMASHPERRLRVFWNRLSWT
jgi:hypothetical protein